MILGGGGSTEVFLFLKLSKENSLDLITFTKNNATAWLFCYNLRF